MRLSRDKTRRRIGACAPGPFAYARVRGFINSLAAFIRLGDRAGLSSPHSALTYLRPGSMTYPLTATGPGRFLLEAAPGNQQHGCIPHGLERRRSLETSPRDPAKGAKPAFDAPVLAALVFSVKTFVAAMLALCISFWLGLDEPYWALLTVFIVAQPDSGLVLAKGFYRLLGTTAGILATTALVFAFAQYGELFIASIAAWIGVCSFAARGARNFASYGFQLAGYIAAIVRIPAALNPHGAYTVIVARCTEITLGIGCAALVSRLIFPRHLTPNLIALADQLFHHVDRFAEIAMDPAAGRQQLASEREGLAEDFGAVETMRSSAYFESPDARLVGQPLRDAVHAAVDVYSVAEAATLHPCPDPEDFPNPDSSITDAGRASHEDAQTVFAFRRAADMRALARARARLDECVTALAKGEGLSKPIPAGPLWSDPLTAVVTGTRSALAIVITAAFWFLTAWPSGPVAVIAAGVACTLLAPTQDPAKITAAAGATVLVFAIPLFVTQICLLPYALDFFQWRRCSRPICSRAPSSLPTRKLLRSASWRRCIWRWPRTSITTALRPTTPLRFSTLRWRSFWASESPWRCLQRFSPRPHSGRLAGFPARFAFI